MSGFYGVEGAINRDDLRKQAILWMCERRGSLDSFWPSQDWLPEEQIGNRPIKPPKP